MTDFQIIQVENGWLVLEGSYQSSGFYKKKWVAHTVADLQELIGKLTTSKPSAEVKE